MLKLTIKSITRRYAAINRHNNEHCDPHTHARTVKWKEEGINKSKNRKRKTWSKAMIPDPGNEQIETNSDFRKNSNAQQRIHHTRISTFEFQQKCPSRDAHMTSQPTNQQKTG